MRLFAMCMLLTIVVVGSVSAQDTSKPSLVGNVTNDTIKGGCGCYFKFRGTPQNAERYVVTFPMEESAWRDMGGRDVKLKVVKQTGKNARRERIGSRSMEKYVSGDITVTGTYVVRGFAIQTTKTANRLNTT